MSGVEQKTYEQLFASSLLNSDTLRNIGNIETAMFLYTLIFAPDPDVDAFSGKEGLQQVENLLSEKLKEFPENQQEVLQEEIAKIKDMVAHEQYQEAKDRIVARQILLTQAVQDFNL